MSTKRKASAVGGVSEREWFTNIHRDSYASHIGHKDMLSYFAVAQNKHVERVRFDMLEKMLQPCAPPPAISRETVAVVSERSH